jgi:Ca2+-binding EF-hand superfamily protein
VAQRKRAPEPDLESRQEQKDLLTRLFTEADSRFRRNYVDAFQLRPLVQAAFRTMTPLVQEDYYNAICGGQESISLQALLSNPYAMMELRPQPMDDTRKARLRRLDEAFDRVDGERTGVLSKTDFPEFARIVWPNIVPVEVGHYENCIFADCDPDNLGAISKSSLAGSQYAELLAGCGIGMAFPDGIERSEDGHGLKKSKLSRLASVDLTLGPSMALALSNPADAATVERHQTAVGHNAPQHLNTVQRERDRLEAIHHKQAQNILAGTATRTAPSKPSRTGLLENERRYASLVTLFERWDESSSQNTEGSNAIEFEELQTVLAEFFNWTPEEADKRAREVMKSLDTNHDGVLQFSEFTPFITGVTRDLEPQIFDELVAHLKQAIGNVSDDAEFERRDTLLEQLFNFWDYDGSEFIEEDEVNDVMTRYLDDPADDNTEEIARMVLHGGLKSPDSPSRSVDSYMFATPRLAMDAFKTLFHSIAKNHAPNDFDLMYYRLRRIVDVANKSARQRAVMNNRLVTVEMQQLVEDSSWSTPLIMYGTTTDPSTALEKMAEAAGQRLQVCMVTNSRSEKLCMKLIEKAFQKGAWFYVVLSPDPYDPVDILRELALRLQASEIAARKAFRLWIWAPFDGGRFHNFPALMLTYAKTLSLDKVKIPHDFRGKAPGPTVVPPLNV